VLEHKSLLKIQYIEVCYIAGYEVVIIWAIYGFLL